MTVSTASFLLANACTEETAAYAGGKMQQRDQQPLVLDINS